MKTAILLLLQLNVGGALSINPAAPIVLALIVWLSISATLDIIRNRGKFLCPN